MFHISSSNLRRQRFRRRRGSTLVLFVLLMFALLGLAALVIDLGFARLSQRQMQTAVDTSAIEGLRGRDRTDVDDAEASRRQAASEVVGLVFDDDLDPTGGDLRQFGAGPVVQLSGGVGDPTLAASQQLSLPSIPVYKPADSEGNAGLEINTANDIHGDMVAGDYDPAQSHVEAGDYSRDDFTPSDDSPAAFLVRMRRSNDFVGLDSQAGVSSHGPSVPFLFGRGSLIGPADPSVGYSPRHHGLTIRATAIADSQRVMSVGLANADVTPPLVGLAPLALELSYWNSLLNDVADTQPVSGDGVVGSRDAVGQLFNLDGPADELPLLIGRELPPSALPAASEIVGFAAIYAIVIDNETEEATDRVVGFGFVEATLASDGLSLDVIRRSGRIAHENGAATAAYRLPVSGEVLTEVMNLGRTVEQPLLAPVLAR